MSVPVNHPRSERPETAAAFWRWPVLIFVAVVIAYAPAWRAPFVYDDWPAIPDNPTIRQLWPLTHVILPQSEGGLTVSGRPVLNLSLAANYAISGTAPWSYHATNVLIHAMAAVVLFGLVRRTLQRTCAEGASLALSSEMLAGFVALIWAVHPLQTQAVTYTIQRAESLMGLFYLVSLYGLARGTENAIPRLRWLGVSVTACALGMATKEVMATAPLVVLLYDRTFITGSFSAAWKQRRWYYVSLGSAWALLAMLVLSTGGNRGGTVGMDTGVPWWAYSLTQFQAVTRYLALSIWPFPLVFEYGTFWVSRANQILPYACLVVPLLAATTYALRRASAVGFCGAWFFLILSPTSLTPGTLQMIVEHRMYLSLAALIVVGTIAATHLFGVRIRLLLACLALASIVLTAHRNLAYRTHYSLWADTVSKRPDNARAHNGLAEAYAELNRRPDELRHRAEAVRLNPLESHYHYNYGIALAEAGRQREAKIQYETALRLEPQEPRIHNNLALVLDHLGEHTTAMAHHERAMQLAPNVALYHINLGMALLADKQVAAAATQFATALKLAPNDWDARYNLAITQLHLSQPESALTHLRMLLSLKPNDSDAQMAAGQAWLATGRATEAITVFRQLLAQHPDRIDAHLGLGQALALAGAVADASREFATVIQVNPRHAEAHRELADLRFAANDLADAALHYRAALESAPDDALAHHNYAMVLAREERWMDAQRELEIALRLQPDYAEARQHLEQLTRMLRH